METELFINFYEIFDLDPSARPETIERRFRELARRYHPDNLATGDRSRFDSIVKAHDTLKDPERRALYHEQNKHQLPPLSIVGDHEDEETEKETPEAADGADHGLDEVGIGRDISIQNNILTLLYRRRRQRVSEPGIGNAELEMLTGCPHEHLEFHLWYMKAKRWIATGEDGLLAITIDGVDRAATLYRGVNNKRITDQS